MPDMTDWFIDWYRGLKLGNSKFGRNKVKLLPKTHGNLSSTTELTGQSWYPHLPITIQRCKSAQSININTNDIDNFFQKKYLQCSQIWWNMCAENIFKLSLPYATTVPDTESEWHKITESVWCSFLSIFLTLPSTEPLNEWHTSPLEWCVLLTISENN